MRETAMGSDRQDRYLEEIKRILAEALRGRKYQVYLFGSRATGRNRVTSDFDVAVLAPERVSEELSIARDMLQQSNIPLKVDLIELSLASRDLASEAERGGVLLWSN
jgi:predicted nucleotidyltransferase